MVKWFVSLTLLLVGITMFAQGDDTFDASSVSGVLNSEQQTVVPLAINLLDFAILDVEPDPGARVDMGGIPSSLEAGMAISSGFGSNGLVDESLYLNFSARGNGQQYVVRAYANMPIPDEVQITVVPIPEITGNGEVGTAVSDPVVLGTFGSEEVIITGIGSGYTGNGYTGYKLRYEVIASGGVSLDPSFEIIYEIIAQ